MQQHPNGQKAGPIDPTLMLNHVLESRSFYRNCCAAKVPTEQTASEPFKVTMATLPPLNTGDFCGQD
ncbi:MAG: hypothetical protein AAGF98_11175 [Cyanobacteria bacterium P01_H01_bin.153]